MIMPENEIRKLLIKLPQLTHLGKVNWVRLNNLYTQEEMYYTEIADALIRVGYDRLYILNRQEQVVYRSKDHLATCLFLSAQASHTVEDNNKLLCDVSKWINDNSPPTPSPPSKEILDKILEDEPKEYGLWSLIKMMWH